MTYTADPTSPMPASLSLSSMAPALGVPVAPVIQRSRELTTYDDPAAHTPVAHTPVARDAGTTPEAVAAADSDSASWGGIATAAKNACKINSFTHDTPVLMADGSLKPIADVELGDLVWAADPETGEQGPRVVVDLIRHAGLHAMVRVKLADGTTIDATDGHPFWVAGRARPGGSGASGSWVNAIDLGVGDLLVDADGRNVVVGGLTISVEDLTAYNLTVAGLHTYYAGEEPVLVHNSGVGDCGHSLGQFKKLSNKVAKKKDAHRFKKDKFDDAPSDARGDIYKCSKCGYEQVIRKRGR